MNNTASLLPPNATDKERTLEQITARIDDVPTPIRDLWNPDTCPVELLPWLAWAFSIDEWDNQWPEEDKRESIKNAPMIHRHKGTPDSVRRVLRSAGYEEVEIIEGLHRLKRDGTGTRNGHYYHGNLGAWAEYIIVLQRAITNVQATQVRRLLETTAPLRSMLKQLDYRVAHHIHNGQILRDGTYNRGVA